MRGAYIDPSSVIPVVHPEERLAVEASMTGNVHRSAALPWPPIDLGSERTLTVSS
uniref:Uncharacterized protein n=1 Tax=Anguilla anguilla TaxID=7936 RepID=A0A0E9RZ69_ANGAN